MTTTINASTSAGLVQTADTSGALDFQTNGTTALGFDSAGVLKFNSGYGSAATAYGCRAWVNFNGQGTVAIRASGNVTSITDNGTGDYTVNFTNAMPDTNYNTSFGGQQDDTSQALFMGLRLTADSGTGAVVTTTSVRLLSTQAGSATDIYWANVAIFR